MESINGGEFLKTGDDPERIRVVVQTAIDNGRQDGDLIHFGIPVEPELTYWGRSEWYVPEDGSLPGKANAIFGTMLTTVMNREITISGSLPMEEAEDRAPFSLLLATTVKLQ